MSRKRHGTSLDGFLKEEGLFDESQAMAIKEVVVYQLTEAMQQQSLSKSRLAVLLNTSRSQVDRLLDPTRDVTLTTLQRAAALVGRRLRIDLVSRAASEPVNFCRIADQYCLPYRFAARPLVDQVEQRRIIRQVRLQRWVRPVGGEQHALGRCADELLRRRSGIRIGRRPGLRAMVRRRQLDPAAAAIDQSAQGLPCRVIGRDRLPEPADMVDHDVARE